MHYKMSDVVTEIKEKESCPSESKYDRFVGLEHYVSGEIVIRNYGGTEILESAMKVFHSGDILVARRNVYLKRASVAFFDGLTSGDSIILRAKNERIGRLLPFVLNTDDFWDYADQYSDGTMSKRLSPKTLLNYEFDLPNEDKQNDFADLLWAAVDTQYAYKQLLKQTDELVKSQFIEMFGEPTKNTMKWPMRTLSEVAKIDGTMTREYERYANYPHIGIDSIEKNTGILTGYRTVKEDNVISPKYYFGPQHILYSKIRPALNKVALPDFEGLCSADCYPILVNADCDRQFLAHVMRSDYFLDYVLSYSGRSQMPKINRKQLMGFRFPCPPIALQKKFTVLIEQADKSKFEIKKAINEIEELIKSLMQQDFVN